MKKKVLLSVLLSTMVLAMTACGGEIEKESADSPAIQMQEDAEKYVLKLELKETTNPRIMEIVNVFGEYTDSVGNEVCLSYRIPQFHADSESVVLLNQRIVEDILLLVEGEFEIMEWQSSLVS